MNHTTNKETHHVTRLAKAMSAFTNGRSGSADGRDAVALATRGASFGSDGSGAPSAGLSLAPGAIRVGALFAALLAAALLTLAFAVPSAHAAKAWVFQETFGPVNQPTFTAGTAAGNRSTLAVDDDGRLYVFHHREPGPETLSRWNPDGTPANFAALGTNVIDGAGAGGCTFPPTPSPDCDETPQGSIGGAAIDQVAVDNSGGVNDGNIYLTDRFDKLINIFDADGTYLGQLTASDEGPLGGSNIGSGPKGVAVDDDGAIYVSDGNRGAVQKYEPAAKPPVNADNTASFPISGSSFDLQQLAAGVGPTDGYIFVGGVSIRKVNADSGSIQYTVTSRGYSGVAVEPTSGTVFGFTESNEATNFTEYDASGAGGATVLAHVQNAGGGLINGIAPIDSESLYFHRGGLDNVQIWEAVASQEVETGPPALISGAKATVTGTVEPFGTTLTECFFEYDTAPYPESQPPGTEAAPAHGQTAPCDPDAASIPADGGSHQVTGELTGMLANGATYHYRLVTNGVASVFGQGRSFKTATTYTTDPASGLTGTEATLNGTVKPEGVALTECHFEYGTAFLSSREPCEPDAASIPNTDSDVPVSLALSDLDPGATYRFRLVAENSLGKLIGEERTFTVKGKPVVDQQPIDVTQTTATLLARINPAGSDTTFHFEWGPDTSYGNRIPANFEQGAGEGTVPVLRTGFVSGLQPSSTYHFRVVASNAFGTTVGPDQRFETLAANGLLDNRAYELVTPADKGPAAVISGDASEQQHFQAAPDGQSFLYPLTNGLDSSTAGGWLRQLASRSSDGWFSAQLSPPSLIPPPGGHEENRKEQSRFRFAAPDNSCGFVETFNPITSDTPPASVELGVTNLYRWNADGSYQLITDRLPLNPEFATAAAYYTQVNSSDDCDRVYFRTSGYEFISGASGLYEWDEGTLRDAGVLPNGDIGAPMGLAGKAVLGGQVDRSATSRWNAVSPDGSRMFFTAIAKVGPSAGSQAVFMREHGAADPVIEISASETGVATKGARFEAASPDASRVFFRANYGIDAQNTGGAPTGEKCGPDETDSQAFGQIKIEKKPCDLYAYDVETGELTDLSADTNPANPIGAAIQGTVAVDEDGSHVYFAALGQLVPGKGRTYAQNTAGNGSANVYLAHDGELTYVTTLAEHGTVDGVKVGDLFGVDQRDRGAALMRRSEAWVANTTPDGGKLLFISSLNLTGYESGGRDRFVVYLYSADSGKLACVSCRPDGLPSLLKDDPSAFPHESTWLLAPPEPSQNYRPRSISDDGSRVFFSSPDPLATGAVAGGHNVYEWHQGQVSLLVLGTPGGNNGVRRYLDSTPDGKTVFIGTKEQLVPQDRDFVSDVYAVRVGGGFPFTPDPPECQVNEAVPLEANQIYCQGEKSAAPAGAAPHSAGFVGHGNVKEKINPCNRRARRAQALSKRAKALRRRAKRASNAKATRRNANQARRAAKGARRNSKAAKRCRQRARSANANRGGNR